MFICVKTRVAEPDSKGVGGFWLESESDFFVRLRLRKSNWVIFYITLLNWEFLLKWYNFFWNREFLLCTTISIDFNIRQNLFLLC